MLCCWRWISERIQLQPALLYPLLPSARWRRLLRLPPGDKSVTSTRMLYFPQPQQDQAQRSRQPETAQAAQVQQQQQAAPACSPSVSVADKAFDLSPDLICILGFDGCIRAVNPATEKVLGFRKSELIGKSLISLVHLEDREATLGHDRDLLAGTATLPLENRVRRQ